MKRKIILPLASLFILTSALAYAQRYIPEKILLFRSQIEIHQDGSMTVTETIKVNSSGNQIKRGIYRDFPTKYKDRLGNNYVVDFDVTEVLRGGLREPHHFKNLNNGRRLYIGKEDFLLPAGEYTYTITYKTNRQLGFFKDFDELYWNVTGNGWSFTIEEAEAVVELPEGAREKVIAIDGYTGYFGAKGKDFSSSTDIYGNVVFTTTRILKPQEGLTIVVSWPKGFVQEPNIQMRLWYFMRDNRIVVVGLLGLLFLLAYYLIIWNRVGRDPVKGTIIPLYNPPDNLSPQDVRYIMKMGFDNKAFCACIINMAVKGYLSISEEKGVYTIKKTGIDNSVLTEEEMEVSRKLLTGYDEIELKNENHAEISKAILNLKYTLKKNFEKEYFFTNTQYFIPGLFFSGLIMIACVASQPTEKMIITMFISFWLTIWTIGVAALLHTLISLWKGFIRAGANKPFLLGGAMMLSIFSVPFVLGEILGLGVFTYFTSITTIPVLALIVFINILFYNLLKAPTFSGRKIMDKIEGFKMYLATAEKERLNILNPPEKTPELFEKYLPYALALDVEQAWSEQFSDCLSRVSASGEHYSPGWYSGRGWNTLGAVGFVSGFGSSFSNSISSASVAPGSSSGGGFGGGGGGGSSGGGGGGGGGGGW
ncbi:MAG: DUF2207 domain-containing protein [Candidatus Omnitrophica bacterium]|nr:DUF2207 domain-containing protein [Candidatus Omnitrophota bacterium]